ncbi:hypothetical protein BCR34DRAFT_139053 [Clohesyomyces aquaticus]|uniref:Uncharacterized protein n=1 Tax=Clohesyomyces aquaticus TaxID=1231657 RepID=A0A1Y2A148_9PLEO|nr:hypothetical protein BCR34DRAFT_139053 [Clohesyomyces aquaticus]
MTAHAARHTSARSPGGYGALNRRDMSGSIPPRCFRGRHLDAVRRNTREHLSELVRLERRGVNIRLDAGVFRYTGSRGLDAVNSVTATSKVTQEPLPQFTIIHWCRGSGLAKAGIPVCTVEEHGTARQAFSRSLWLRLEADSGFPVPRRPSADGEASSSSGATWICSPGVQTGWDCQEPMSYPLDR